MSLIKKLAILAIAASANSITFAGEAFSWNLSRDMLIGIKKNPYSVWSYQKAIEIHNPSTYANITTYAAACNGISGLVCWSAEGAMAGIPTKTFIDANGVAHTRGVPLLHPGPSTSIIVRWKSPITGKVTLTGRFSHEDYRAAGDGVRWYIDKNSTQIGSGAIFHNGNTFLISNISINKGESIYFIVDSGENSYDGYDTTSLDAFITLQN